MDKDKTKVYNIKDKDYNKGRKKNRKSGSDFELKVRKDLEKQGWTVSKWPNNIDWFPQSEDKEDKKLLKNYPFSIPYYGKLIPAKHVFNPFGICLVQILKKDYEQAREIVKTSTTDPFFAAILLLAIHGSENLKNSK